VLQVVDYSWARPTPQSIRDFGYAGAIRYLSFEPGKNLSGAERDALWAAGLAVALVWETTANRAAGGFDAGAADGVEANRQADALGWPPDRPIYFTVDYDAGPEGPVTGYFHGANSTAWRPVGCYGSYRVIEGIVGTGVVGWGWQCAAWSGDGAGSGGVSSDGRRLSVHARLYQRAVTVMGGACDANDVYHPDWGGWAPTPDGPTLIAIREAIDRAVQQVLRQGDRGEAVVWAQLMLNKKLGAVLEPDGVFGPLTTWWTAVFQTYVQRYVPQSDIQVDGVIGPATWFYLTSG
jgi:hypothetical protein